MKIVTVLGARPQFVKAATVSREIRRCREQGADLHECIVHTGQHYDTEMSDVFFDEMKIPSPDYKLGIGGKPHGAMTGQMLERVEEVLMDEKPDVVMVYGDTNSTLAGSLAASKLRIPVAHVEAGLRSFNMAMPEEINRVVTDRLSSLLFCPTQTAIQNLEREGYQNWGTNAELIQSGDVMYDSAMFYSKLESPPEGLDVDDGDFVLCTIHRSENTDDPRRLREIVAALSEIGSNTTVVLPLHPRTKQRLKDAELEKIDHVVTIDPVGYLSMVWLLKRCKCVMTDSGGLQKEAFFFQKPCVTLRDETEWVELVEHRHNVLVGACRDAIVHQFHNFSFSTSWLSGSMRVNWLSNWRNE